MLFPDTKGIWCPINPYVITQMFSNLVSVNQPYYHWQKHIVYLATTYACQFLKFAVCTHSPVLKQKMAHHIQRSGGEADCKHFSFIWKTILTQLIAHSLLVWFQAKRGKIFIMMLLPAPTFIMSPFFNV